MRDGVAQDGGARSRSFAVRGMEPGPVWRAAAAITVVLLILLSIYLDCQSQGDAAVGLSFSCVSRRPYFLAAVSSKLSPALSSPGGVSRDGVRIGAPAAANAVQQSSLSPAGLANFAAATDAKASAPATPVETIGPSPNSVTVGSSAENGSIGGGGEPAATALSPPTQKKPMETERRLSPQQELVAAKRAIEESTAADADLSLYSVIYRNVSAFSKSYRLMEETFRVYVYREGHRPLVHTGPVLGIYASEGKFIRLMNRRSSCVTQNPEKAHMFYLPYSVTEMSTTIYVVGSHSMRPLNDFISSYVSEVSAKYPFWNRTRGADHFFLSCHDWGPATARDHPELRANAVKVVCNADLTEEFVVGKDVSLPEVYMHKPKRMKMGGPGPGRRRFLAFFAGQMHGRVRPALIEHWKGRDPDMQIFEVLPKPIERKMNYAQHMKSSKFCICAAGFEVNSPRLVESIYYDCVPVIIADNFVLPFSDVLEWSAFSLTLPESEIPNLKTILSGIRDRQYISMQRRLAKVRQHFIWNDQPVKYDIFHMILHSVWTSRLAHIDL